MFHAHSWHAAVLLQSAQQPNASVALPRSVAWLPGTPTLSYAALLLLTTSQCGTNGALPGGLARTHAPNVALPDAGRRKLSSMSAEAAAPPAVPSTWYGVLGASTAAFLLTRLPVRSPLSSGVGFETRSPSLAS